MIVLEEDNGGGLKCRDLELYALSVTQDTRINTYIGPFYSQEGLRLD